MAYRDFEEALLEERRTLVEEIERLDAERARFQANLRRRDELAERLRQLDSRIDSSDTAPSALLEGLWLATPCSARWEDMIGDDRVRFCASCAKNVYDLSSLSENELQELIAQTEGKFCGRLRKRHDGTVLTDDCPVGARRKRRLQVVATAMAAAGAAVGAASIRTTHTTNVTLLVTPVEPVAIQIEPRVQRSLPRIPTARPRDSYVMGRLERRLWSRDKGKPSPR